MNEPNKKITIKQAIEVLENCPMNYKTEKEHEYGERLINDLCSALATTDYENVKYHE